MSHLQIVKGVVHIVSMAGVTKLVSEVVKNNTVAVTMLDKVLINTGSLVLGSLVGKHASNHVVEQLDKLDKYQVTIEKENDETEEPVTE
jgi:hypothetical protein